MTKLSLILLSLVLYSSCAFGQMKYSSSNKKAVALFEEGMNQPRLDPSKKAYITGLDFLKKAIEKDPKFWEAYLLGAEFAEYAGDFPTAISMYQSALAINPEHSSTGSTFFFLGSLQFETGAYEESISNLTRYLRGNNVNPAMANKANTLLQSAQFAKASLAKPVSFQPINLGPGVNTADPEYFPTITVDGGTLLFTRLIKDARIAANSKEEESRRGRQEDFYVSQLSDKGSWMKATPMPQNINTEQNEGAPSIAADGRTLIFVACPDYTGQSYGDNRSGKGSCDLFVTKKLGSRWSNPVNLPGFVNTNNWESQPSLSSDGKTLYFIRATYDKNGTRNSDIYYSILGDDGLWSKGIRLPDHINTPDQEESVLIHPDGKTLYFASRGHVGMGGLDLYVTRKDDAGNWSKPENLGYPINTAYDENSLLVSADGDIAFFASNREGGFGDLDIYYFEMPEHLKPTKTIYFKGLVYDAKTKEPLPGKFQLIDLSTGKEVIKSDADAVNGEFMISLPLKKEYALNVNYKGYNFFSKNFNMVLDNEADAFVMDVPMVKLGQGSSVLRNVFFDLAKTSLRPESNIELDKLKEYLLENPSFHLELSGHTDTRGDATENQKLSEGRAISVKNYLVSKGIAANRITALGKGESQPIHSDAYILGLKSEQEKENAHQENRRTEYLFIPK